MSGDPTNARLASSVSSLKHSSEGHDVATYPCAKGRAVNLGFEGGLYSTSSPASLLVGHGPEGDIFQYRVRSIMVTNINEPPAPNSGHVTSMDGAGTAFVS
jgi:hypothetical protein